MRSGKDIVFYLSRNIGNRGRSRLRHPVDTSDTRGGRLRHPVDTSDTRGGRLGFFMNRARGGKDMFVRLQTFESAL
jgi:hypothetical protein